MLLCEGSSSELNFKIISKACVTFNCLFIFYVFILKLFSIQSMLCSIGTALCVQNQVWQQYPHIHHPALFSQILTMAIDTCLNHRNIFIEIVNSTMSPVNFRKFYNTFKYFIVSLVLLCILKQKYALDHYHICISSITI